MRNKMTMFIGTKIINAKPMTRLEYNQFRGWKLPADENGEDEGYLVEYIDRGGKANTKEYSGYVSWSPKDVFDRAYRETGKLAFGDALVFLKEGKKVARSGWNGKNMWIFLCKVSSIYWVDDNGNAYSRQDYLYMKTAQDMVVPWVASQSDMLSEDWYVLEN